MYTNSKKIISICTAATLALTSSIVATKVSAADLPENTRLWGTDRYETAVKISQNGWKSGAEYAILASGEGYADALCATPLAKSKNAPILLTKQNSLNEDTLKELKRLGVKQVYIIGGNGSVSKEVEYKVKSIAKNIERIQGEDRYETSVKVAEKLGENDEIMLASGEGYADALSAAPVAAIKGIPIILTKAKGEFADALSGSAIAARSKAPVILTGQILNNETRNLAKEKFYPTTKITVLGGVENISDKIVNQMKITGENIKTEGEIENKNIYSNLVITAKNVDLRESNVKGNLYIEGDNVTLLNVDVNGTIYINPGDENTCKLENVIANEIIVLSGREDGINFINTKAENLYVLNNDNVRIIIEQDTNISKTKVLTSTTLQVEDGCFGEVIIPKTFNKKAIKFIGSFEKPIKVEGQAYLKELSDACIKTVEVRSDKNDEIVLDGQFNSVDVYSAADIKTKENTSTVIRGKNLDAKSNATIYVPDKSDVKVRNFNEDNISGDGKIDALSESI